MARPLKEGLDYFPHDTDTCMDEKLEDLEAVYGNDGYAAYFKLLERIYRKNGKIFISDAETRQKYAKVCNIHDVEKFEKMLSFMIKTGLFDEKLWIETKALTSNGILKRMEVVINKRLRMKDYHNKRVSAAETPAESTQSKVKESKVKESKVKESKVLPPKKPAQKEPLKTVSEMQEEIKNFKKILKWEDIKIKQNFLERGYTEAQFDLAMGKEF